MPILSIFNKRQARTECLLHFQGNSRRQFATAAAPALEVESVPLLQTEYVEPLPEKLVPPMMKSDHLQFQKHLAAKLIIPQHNVTLMQL